METKYENPTPVAVAVVRIAHPDGLKLLAIRRAIAPHIGSLALPGGFIEKMEDADHAAQRELDEETGIVLQKDGWKPLVTHVTPDNRLLIFMLAPVTLPVSALDGFVPTKEASELLAVGAGDELCFSLHQAVLNSDVWHRASSFPTLYAVLTMNPGYAREDAGTPGIIGIYSDAALAKAVATCLHGQVAPNVVLDLVPPGVYGIAKELGIKLPGIAS